MRKIYLVLILLLIFYSCDQLNIEGIDDIFDDNDILNYIELGEEKDIQILKNRIVGSPFF